MSKSGALMEGSYWSSMVSPLVDVVCNLMITMFIFLMIYMAVVIPRKELRLAFVNSDLPNAACYVPYVAGVGVRGGSGQVSFFALNNGERVDLEAGAAADGGAVRIKGAPEPARRIVVTAGRLDVNAPGPRAGKETLETKPGGEDGERVETGLLTMDRSAGVLRGQFTANAFGLKGWQGACGVSIVAVDNLMVTKVPKDRVERWGDVTLYFYQDWEAADQAAGVGVDRVAEADLDESASGENDESDAVLETAHYAIRKVFPIRLKREKIPFNPEEHPLTISAPAKVAGRIGAPLEVWPSIVGGIEPYEIEVRGVPKGMRVDARSGVISGAPEVLGEFTIEFEVKDGQTPRGDWTTARDWSQQAGRPFVKATTTLVAASGPRPLEAALVLPGYGRKGEPCPGSVTAWGGVGRKRFAARGLPPSMALNPDTGVISGSPDAVGEHEITVEVADENTDSKASRVVLQPRKWRVLDALPGPAFWAEPR